LSTGTVMKTTKYPFMSLYFKKLKNYINPSSLKEK